MIFSSQTMEDLENYRTFAKELCNLKSILIMSTSTMRVPTSFRLQEDLLKELKACAKAANRSLNNYVESILMDVMNTTKVKKDNSITPELQAKIDKARGEHVKGETLRFETAQDAIAWMETL